MNFLNFFNSKERIHKEKEARINKDEENKKKSEEDSKQREEDYNKKIENESKQREEVRKSLKNAIIVLQKLGYAMITYTYDDNNNNNSQWNQIAIDNKDNTGSEDTEYLWYVIARSGNHCILFEQTKNGKTIQALIKYNVYSVDDNQEYFYTDNYGKENKEVVNNSPDETKQILPSEFIKLSNEYVTSLIKEIESEKSSAETTPLETTSAGKRKTLKRKKHRKTRK